MKKNSNNLISEKSPYLLQHAFNPVNWYPWGEEAFRKALAGDKPIFLSIGYSTCHWCHVMEEESFEDIEVAKLMNDVFVCIKVDREERPDIDKIYMEFCQMLTGSGGWPLTIIMTPDKKPFFAGTYIPKQNKYGRIGMLALVPQIKELWLNERSNVLKSSEEIVRHFSKQFVFSSQGIGLDKTILDLTFENLIKLFDKTNGGFGKSPKFPTIHHLYFLLRYWKKTKNKKALEMVEKTLEAMRFGGIWDQIGFGFHRYSTDEKWIVPHFEKMLYDQALISIAYIEAYQATSCEKYKKTVEEIFTYILRDMTSKEGGFYSAEDADSEGVEGKFYCWTKDEIKKIFPVKESVMIIDIFNIGRSNLETGSVLYVTESAEDIAAKYNLTLEDLNEFLHSSTNKMFNERKKRIHPFKDDKILTDWNGMMISALALGARVFDKKVYEEAAVRAADFIINNLITKEGFLLHRYRDGQSAITANLDDYSFFIMGLLELYETTFNKSYLKIALELNKVLLDNFWDYDNGGFYFTPGDSEMKNFRLKDIYDGAIPSGNSISILNLTKLGRITATLDFEDKALQIVKTFSKPVNEAPEAHTQFISSLDFIIGPAHEIVIVGYPDAKETRKIFGAMNNVFAPNKIVILKIPGIPDITTTEFPGFVKDLKMINNESTIYVCSDYNCKLPTNNIDEMLQLLN